jgi:hypothetical protein
MRSVFALITWVKISYEENGTGLIIRSCNDVVSTADVL